VEVVAVDLGKLRGLPLLGGVDGGALVGGEVERRLQG
jgi:hypothetical protein